jgi:hypothetical protein
VGCVHHFYAKAGCNLLGSIDLIQTIVLETIKKLPLWETLKVLLGSGKVFV